MLDALPFTLLLSSVLGFLTGLGVGGGSLLILWLTAVLGTAPDTARSMNLLFFLPSAFINCLFRRKQGKLDLKYNVDEIEEDAKALGMIKRQYADNEYLTVNGEEQIIIYEDGESDKVGLAALLSSFGIELD